jgi:cytochrome P450
MPETTLPRHALEAVTHANPWPYYAVLRREWPLVFDAALGLWVAADAATVEAALRHPQLQVRPPDEPVPRALVGTPSGEVFARLVRMNDGEFHGRERPRVETSLRRWNVGETGEAGAHAARDLAGRVDANELLSAVPVQAMARLLGVPAAARDETVRAVQRFTQSIVPGALPDAIAQGGDAAQLLLAQGHSLGCDRQQAIHRIAFMQQSLDATAGLLGNGVLRLRALSHAPQDWLAWTAELARFDAPVHNTRRFAAADVELAGQPVRAGQGVLVLLASANRDAALNADPDTFDEQRTDRRMLGFGAGAHRCPGEAIAIAIAAAALRHWHEAGSMPQLFGRATGFRPLANARIPVFET